MCVQKVLHLNLKKRWYDMISSGSKNEEYREIKKYWMDRLFHCHQESLINPKPKPYNVVLFRNGYRRNPQMAFEIEEITVGFGHARLGATPDKLYYIIKLGRRLTQVRELIKTNTSNIDLWVWEPK